MTLTASQILSRRNIKKSAGSKRSSLRGRSKHATARNPNPARSQFLEWA